MDREGFCGLSAFGCVGRFISETWNPPYVVACLYRVNVKPFHPEGAWWTDMCSRRVDPGVCCHPARGSTDLACILHGVMQPVARAMNIYKLLAKMSFDETPDLLQLRGANFYTKKKSNEIIEYRVEKRCTWYVESPAAAVHRYSRVEGLIYDTWQIDACLLLN